MPTASLSRRADERLRHPAHRGAFIPKEAARKQLGLLSVADDAGQARIYWLIDLDAREVREARFLAYGDLLSHPLADAFTELVIGRPFDDAVRMDLAPVEALLRDDPATPVCEPAALRFLQVIQERAAAAIDAVVLLPPPEEKEVYRRKSEEEWDEQDRAWLPLSLLRKVGKVQSVCEEVIAERAGDQDPTWSVEGLHDDFRVVMSIDGLPEEEVPTLLLFIGSTLRDRIHPGITVETRDAGEAQA